MFLLFLVAGMSTQFSLRTKSLRMFFVSRTQRLLIPSTLGVLVFQWILGYYYLLNTGWCVYEGTGPLVCLTYGIGHLWFILELWVLSIIIAFIRFIDKEDAIWKKMSIFFNKPSTQKYLGYAVVFVGLIIIGFVSNIQWNSEGLIASYIQYLFRPIFYLTAYLLGYYVFSHDIILEILDKYRIAILLLSIIFAIIHTSIYFGETYVSLEIFRSPSNILFLWFTTLSFITMFRHYCNKQTKFSSFCTKNCFGMYVTHYLIVCVCAYHLRQYVDILTPFGVYSILLVVTFVGSYVLYALLSRIPVVRYCVFGIKKNKGL